MATYRVPKLDGSNKLPVKYVPDPAAFGAATPADLTAGLAGKVNTSTYTAGLATKQDTATLAADVASHVADGSALTTALGANLEAVQKVAAAVSANGAAVVNSHNPVDASAAARTLTLPTGQAEGATISVEKTDASVNTVTISGNIRNAAGQTRALAWQNETLVLRADSTGSWWPVAGHKTKTSLEANLARGKFLAITQRDLVPPTVMASPPSIAYFTTEASSTPQKMLTADIAQNIYGVQAMTYTTSDGTNTGYAKQVSNAGELTPYLFGFRTDAAQVDLVYQGSASPTLRVLVDGQLLQATPLVATGGGGGLRRLAMTFPSATMRKIEIESSSMFIRSVNVAAAATIAPLSKPQITVAGLGDSYAVNSNGRIFMECCRLLGVAPLVNGEGGTGYNNNNSGTGGKQIFLDRLPGLLSGGTPDVLVVLGGINDGTTTLQADAQALVAAAKAIKPNMAVVLVGSQTPPTAAGSGATKAALLKTAAAAAGAFFVDMSAGHIYDTTGAQIYSGRQWIFGTGTAGINRTVTDAVTNSTTTVTSATAAFVAGDVGRIVTGAGIPANAKINSVTNGTTVVISSAATATASGVTLNLTNQRNDGNADVYIGTDGTHPYTSPDGIVPDGYAYHGLRLAGSLQAVLAAL